MVAAVFINTPTPIPVSATALSFFYAMGWIGLALAFGIVLAQSKPSVRRVFVLAFLVVLLNTGIVFADTVIGCGWCDCWWMQWGLCIPAA